jgi:hypothetical protein
MRTDFGESQRGETTMSKRAQADQAASNKEIIHKFIALFQSGRWDGFDEVIASDCVLHYPGGVDELGWRR